MKCPRCDLESPEGALFRSNHRDRDPGMPRAVQPCMIENKNSGPTKGEAEAAPEAFLNGLS